MSLFCNSATPAMSDLKIGGMIVPSNSVDGVVATAISAISTSFFHSIQLNSRHHHHHSSQQRHLHLSYNDLSIYLSTHTLNLISDFLFFKLNLNGMLMTNVNVNVNPTKFLSLSSLSNSVLCAGARRILSTPNAGGSSVLSEVLSAELLNRLFGATVIKTETEITYRSRGSPITDYACQLSLPKGKSKLFTVGVSVTRAMAYRRPLNKNDVHRLLVKKLKGINASTQMVTNCTFARQILHVWAQSGRDAAIVKRVWAKLPDTLRSNTIVLVTTINCPLLFFEKQDDKIIQKIQKKSLGFKKWY